MSEGRVVRSVAELKKLVGQETGVGQWFVIDQERVNRFADLTGDHQYIHVDPERAARTPFGGTIAHGYLTLSLQPLLGREREGVSIELPTRMAVNMGTNRVRFPGPVPVGRRIRLHTRLLSVKEGPDYVEIVNEQTVEVEGAERPGMVAETVSRLYL
ncbi:MAG TPA: MaoC family dehydratase [Chloroflexota bacterium]|jgi:acyl dehydratase